MGWGDDHRHRGALRLVECWGDDVPQGKLMPAPWLHQRRREPIVIMGCRIELAHAFQRYAMNREDALLEDWRARALALESAVKHVVVGMDRVIRLVTIAVFARGHVLLEGDVGVGTTTLLR